MADDLIARAQGAFDRVKDAPENRPDGFVRLVELRNLVPELIDRITALEAQLAEYESGAVRVRKL